MGSDRAMMPILLAVRKTAAWCDRVVLVPIDVKGAVLSMPYEMLWVALSQNLGARSASSVLRASLGAEVLGLGTGLFGVEGPRGRRLRLDGLCVARDPPTPGVVDPWPPTLDTETTHPCHFGTSADNRLPIAMGGVLAQEMSREVVSALRKKVLAVSADKVKVCSAGGLFAIQLNGRTIQSQSEFRVLCLHVGATDHELRITASWKAFRSIGILLIAKCVALSVLCPRFGAWSWRLSHDVWRAINTMTMRMLRAMVDIPRKPDEPWLFWRMRSWRSCQAWVRLKQGSPRGTNVPMSCIRQRSGVPVGPNWAHAAHAHKRCTFIRSGPMGRRTNCMQCAVAQPRGGDLAARCGRNEMLDARRRRRAPPRLTLVRVLLAASSTQLPLLRVAMTPMTSGRLRPPGKS